MLARTLRHDGHPILRWNVGQRQRRHRQRREHPAQQEALDRTHRRRLCAGHGAGCDAPRHRDPAAGIPDDHREPDAMTSTRPKRRRRPARRVDPGRPARWKCACRSPPQAYDALDAVARAHDAEHPGSHPARPASRPRHRATETFRARQKSRQRPARALASAGVLDRAYALLTVKALDAERRTISAAWPRRPRPTVAATSSSRSAPPSANPLPLLLHHDRQRPGRPGDADGHRAGIAFEATLPEVPTPAPCATG